MLILSRAVTILLLFFIAQSIWAADLPQTEKIDINSAPLEDLVKIIHIGETRAKELISLRPFSSLDDLTRIKGIGESRLNDIKQQGLAWVSGQSSESELLKPVVEESPQQYPKGIIINEILPSPSGPDAEEEWMEIFNQNSFAVDLSGWQITDTSGNTINYTFPAGKIIQPQEYLVLTRPLTKIIFNNDGDLIKIISPDGRIADSVEYASAPQGESFNRTESGWSWSKNLTPGAENNIAFLTEKEENAAPATSAEKGIIEEAAAAISQPLKNTGEEKKGNAYLVFFTALIFSLFSGIMILFLKRKLRKVDF